MPTPDTQPLLALLRRTIGTTVLGVYLHGSATLGGLRPHSDVDALVVVRRSPTGDERRELLGELLKMSGGGNGARPVELIVVVQDDVRPWRYPPPCDFLYGEWQRGDYERGVIPAPEPSPDLAPLLTMVLLGDAPLYGPPPAEVLDPVPQDDLRRAITAGVPELLDELDTDTRNVLLTLARIWTTLATGTIRAKDAAADWVLPRLPPSTGRSSPMPAPSTWGRRWSTGRACGPAFSPVPSSSCEPLTLSRGSRGPRLTLHGVRERRHRLGTWCAQNL